MSSKSHMVPELCGIISGLSHVFILKKQHLFVFNITSEAGTSSVVVRRQSQLSWQTTLKVGVVYICCKLKRTKLYQGTEDEVDVLVAGSQTKIIPGNIHDSPRFQSDRESTNLISYKGTVTAADPSLQLYELDGSCRLSLSALAVVSDCPQLRCGDQVVVYDGHWDPAERRLDACGRTHVQLLNRPPEPVVSSKRTLVHTLHRFTLPPSAAGWLRQTAAAVAAVTGGSASADGETGPLHRLLMSEKLPGAERSLVKEFVCRPHRCIASKQFRPPFELTPLSSLLSAAVADSAAWDPCERRPWRHWVGAGTGRRSVGRLGRGQAGVWLGDGDGRRVPLVVLGGGRVPEGAVGVLEPRVVVERMGEGEPAVYLLCEGEQLVPLEDEPADPQPPHPPAPPTLLLYQRSAPRHPPSAPAPSLLLHGLLTEPGGRRPVLLRLTGAALRRAQRLHRGAAYRLVSREARWTDRRQNSCHVQKQLRPWLVDCELLAGPEDLWFTPDTDCPQTRQLTCQPLSVSDLSPGGGGCDDADDVLLTVRGVILERSHARDRFARPAPHRPVSLDTHRIVLRLCDPVTGDEVTLYICEPSQWCSLLGLLPGASLTAHAVRWAGGQAGTSAAAGTYLLTTPLSELEVAGWSPPPEQAGRRPRLHLPVRFLSSALCDPSLTRWLSCVTLADLCRVSLTAECGLCGHQLSGGGCGFVGCHGAGRHVVNARARAVLDDGSAAVTAQLVGASVRHLLALSDAQWRALAAEAAQSGDIYHLQARTKGGRAADSAGLLSSVCRAASLRRPLVCELKKFTERPPAAEGGAGPVQTVFCEAVMEATPAVVTRLYPAPATAAVAAAAAVPSDFQMAD